MAEEQPSLLDEVAHIVASYVANNSLATSELPALISNVYAALQKVAAVDLAPAPTEAKPLVPAVSVKKSITPDFLISLEDGKRYKSLKRHLMTSYGMTPDEYRRKWSLPNDYPMVAPNYAAARSAMAVKMGLGRKKVEEKPELVAAPAAEGPKRRGRTKKAA